MECGVVHARLPARLLRAVRGRNEDRGEEQECRPYGTQKICDLPQGLRPELTNPAPFGAGAVMYVVPLRRAHFWFAHKGGVYPGRSRRILGCNIPLLRSWIPNNYARDDLPSGVGQRPTANDQRHSVLIAEC